MEIKAVQVELCFNLGNFENEKIRLIAELDPDDDIKDVVAKLREGAIASASENDDSSWRRRTAMVSELKALGQKLTQASEQWQRTKEFLQAQGIKTDVEDMPQFDNLLLPGTPEVDCELVDQDGIPF